MTFKNSLPVWYGGRYWKQPQTLYLALGHLNYTGFIFPKINRL